VEVEEKMMALSTVRSPSLAKRMMKMAITPRETIPPEAEVYYDSPL
jgi:hypothetical protein